MVNLSVDHSYACQFWGRRLYDIESSVQQSTRSVQASGRLLLIPSWMDGPPPNRPFMIQSHGHLASDHWPGGQQIESLGITACMGLIPDRLQSIDDSSWIVQESGICHTVLSIPVFISFSYWWTNEKEKYKRQEFGESQGVPERFWWSTWTLVDHWSETLETSGPQGDC